jgi:hypothetical protein
MQCALKIPVLTGGLRWALGTEKGLGDPKAGFPVDTVRLLPPNCFLLSFCTRVAASRNFAGIKTIGLAVDLGPKYLDKAAINTPNLLIRETEPHEEIVEACQVQNL